MRHIDIRDLWLQKEARDSKIRILKVPGEQNPADLMTKILSKRDIRTRLENMNIEMFSDDHDSDLAD